MQRRRREMVTTPHRTRPSSEPFGPGPPGESKALAWLALLGLVGILWVALPVAVGVLLGALMAFSAQPLFEALCRHIRQRWLASLVAVTLSTLLITTVIGGMGYVLVSRGLGLTERLVASLEGPHGTATLDALARPLGAVGISRAMVLVRARSTVDSLAAGAAAAAAHVASATASALLALFLAVLTMQIVLPRWSSFAVRVQQTLPIRPEYTRELFVEFRKIGRGALLGSVVTGIVQGALATIGYAISHVPEPIFFGVATTVASFVPGVGALLVWVPVGIVLLLSGHVAAGVFELGWGLAIVNCLCDYGLRPRLVGGEAYPTPVTFVALFGGVQVFGLQGLIVGPVLMALGFAVVRMYAREAAARRVVSHTEEQVQPLPPP